MEVEMNNWMKFILGLVGLGVLFCLGITSLVGLFFNPMTHQVTSPTQPDGVFQPPASQPTAPAATEQPTASQPVAPAPYNLPPQPQVGHPSLYLETGVPDPYGINIDQHTKHWRIELLPGTVAIVGGFKVDGVSNGVYKAIAGPGVLDTIVTDGFVAITKAEWANAEFCFRLAQATQLNWAHQTVIPLPGWATCN